MAEIRCEYCEGKGKQFEALTMEVEQCLYCGGTGKVVATETECTCLTAEIAALKARCKVLEDALQNLLDTTDEAHSYVDWNDGARVPNDVANEMDEAYRAARKAMES